MLAKKTPQEKEKRKLEKQQQYKREKKNTRTLSNTVRLSQELLEVDILRSIDR